MPDDLNIEQGMGLLDQLTDAEFLTVLQLNLLERAANASPGQNAQRLMLAERLAKIAGRLAYMDEVGSA